MYKVVISAAVCLALAGVALAQVQASSALYLIDVDPARYAGPAGQRVMLRVGDPPRNVVIGAQDEICVQLQRDDGNSEVISVRVRALRPEPQTAAQVRLVGPNIAPGTYRSTPWGLLLRATPGSDSQAAQNAVVTDNAPVCAL
jgi:hypothetical protein